MAIVVDSFGSISEARRAVVKDFARAEALAQSVFRGTSPGAKGFDPNKAARKLEHYSNREIDVLTVQIANFLHRECGVEPGPSHLGGTKVMILSGNRLEAVVAEMAVHELRGTLVADYVDQPLKSLAFVLHDSDTEVVFAENQEQVDRLLTLMRNPYPVTVVDPQSNGHSIEEKTLQLRKIVTFEPVKVEGPGAELVVPLEGILRDSPRTPNYTTTGGIREDVAAIVYTPEATGQEAGVLLTHGNLLSNVAQAKEAEMFHDTSVMAAILPFQHAFGRLNMLSGILSGAALRLPAVIDVQKTVLDVKSLIKDLRMFNSTVITVVPAMLEGMMVNLRREARVNPYVRRCLDHFITSKEAVSPTESAKNGSEWSWNELGSRVTPPSTVRNAILANLGFRKLTKLIVGGAKLPLYLYRFFSELCENQSSILEGFGKTHFGPSTACNRSDDNVPGTVGRPLRTDVEIMTDTEGELFVRGPNVSPGYFRRAALDNRDFFPDGWVRSHDIAVIDPLSKRIVITGKTDEKIVLLNGKNYYPYALEDILLESPYFDQALVIGDNTMYLGAIVSLNSKAAAEWITENQVELREALDRMKKSEEAAAQGPVELNGDLEHDGDILRVLLRKEMRRIDRATLDEVSNKIRKVLVTTSPLFHNLFGLPLTLGERKALILKYERDVDALYHDPNNRKFRFI